MNDENKIDLSIEMYEDLKETLVKAIKNAKAGGVGNAGWENTQLERIERLIEAAERSQGQIAQQLEQLQRNTALSGAKTEQMQEFTDRYNALLAQLAGRLEVIWSSKFQKVFIRIQERSWYDEIRKARQQYIMGNENPDTLSQTTTYRSENNRISNRIINFDNIGNRVFI